MGLATVVYYFHCHVCRKVCGVLKLCQYDTPVIEALRGGGGGGGGGIGGQGEVDVHPVITNTEEGSWRVRTQY